MVPLGYVVSVTLIGTAPMVSVRVVPATLAARWNGVFTVATGTCTDLRIVSAPLTSFEMRSWLDPPEIR